MKFWDSERYKKADELVKKHATGLCLDQISLPHGGVLEKWLVGKQVVVLLAERAAPENRPTRKDGEEFRVEVLAPVTTSNLWEDVDKALGELADPKPALPEPIRKAFEHVRKFHPEVIQVFFGADGRWLYFGPDIDDTPEFGPKIDVGILEDAQDAAEEIGVPCAFAYSERK